MNFDDIRDNIDSGAYENKLEYPSGRKLSEGTVFDENKSVKWNREECERRNQARAQSQENYRREDNRLFLKFRDDLIQATIESSNHQINQKSAELIFSKAYDDGHSGGYCEVMNCASDLQDFVIRILTLGVKDL